MHRLVDPARVDPGVLGEEAERAGAHDPARRRPPGAGQGAQQGRLPGAVAPDQADLVARVHVEARGGEEVAIGDGDGEVDGPEHR